VRHTLPLLFFDTVARVGSIRAAAEQLSITSSALNRRILALEEELGVELFERSAQGVRLNSAGELFIQHARAQLADLERVRSRIADLSGMRRGLVRISATRDLARHFMPAQVQRYRHLFPGVRFEVRAQGRSEAEDALDSQQTDLACVTEPMRMHDFHVLLQTPQPIYAIAPQRHPLMRKQLLRLHDLAEQTLALPPRGDGIRELLEQSAARRLLPLQVAVESDDPGLLESMAAQEQTLCFCVQAGLGPHLSRQGLAQLPLDPRDVRPALLMLGQRRSTALPVAAAKFAEELRRSLAASEGE